MLERNPNYRGDRPARPARIVYLTGIPTAEGVALARAGRADVVPWDYDLHGPLAPGGPLDRRFGASRGGRYRVAPAPGVDMIAFNTRRPLFRDARVRRAVNYALDRKALAAVWGEPPTDRYVPPVVSGPRSDPVYPLSGPDLASARRLLRGRAPASATAVLLRRAIERAHRRDRARESAAAPESTSRSTPRSTASAAPIRRRSRPTCCWSPDRPLSSIPPRSWRRRSGIPTAFGPASAR